MKRVLILAPLLLALALFALLRSRQPEALAVVPRMEGSEAAASETRLSSANEQEQRQSLASAPATSSPPAQPPRAEARPVSADFIGPVLEHAPARSVVTVNLVLRFAGSHEPVRAAFARVFSAEPVRTYERALSDIHDGVLPVIVNSEIRLASVDLCALPGQLAGPRTEENAGGRFRAVHFELNQQLEESDVEIPLELEPARETSGIVRDANTLAPIAEAEIRLGFPASGQDASLASGRDGRFVFADPLTTLRLRVLRDGYTPLNREFARSAAGLQPAQLEFLLQRGIRVAGRVVAPDGDSLNQVQIGLELLGCSLVDGETSRRRVFTTSSKEDGSFVFEDLPRGESASLFAPSSASRRTVYFGPRVELGALHENVSGLLLTTPAATEIEVYAELADGTPLEPWDFVLSSPDPHTEDYRRLPTYSSHDTSSLLDGHRTKIELSDLQRVDRLAKSWLVPLDTTLHLEAFRFGELSASQPDLTGQRELRLDHAEERPIEVHIVLDHVVDLTPPPAPVGATVVELGARAPLVTVDLHLLDADGHELPADSQATIDDSKVQLAQGWVRLSGEIGKRSIRVESHGKSRMIEIEFPRTGYAKLEQPLKEDP